MSLLTESELRRQLKNTDIKEFEVAKGVIITPSAKQYLHDKNIRLVIVDTLGVDKQCDDKIEKEDEGKIFPRYKCIQGGYLEGKPEYMTQLYGDKLVPKDHRRIEFRGRLDSLQSKILEVQVLASKLKNEGVAKDLEEILTFVRNILRAEVLEEKLPEFYLLGMSENDLREMSHNPKKYFNMEHFMPSYKMGEIVVALNSIRSNTREVEIYGFKAFKNIDGEITRNDIMKYLNRLSSCLYIMMFRFQSGKYK
ncbi:cobalamin adenosyltransferase [Clostridium estertheticum]|uniref:Cobalamin adenosyltransferase n=1 Tax=Clostridium estertheticum TaxID=238834 RepID=A0A5N7IYL6_9CLOT|nr:cobalamin adenosyltransferase [Clostridium estertheticum]MCB2339444.1 cobalamin adenosyltransferase [Clostridium estertheticum]MPQ30882.1 cobalamin adenosyltransferase [Clostridium estertheticum]MPQ61558.1 cobalamin adenosyltransferase [Clostridium estertheticum]